MATSYVILSRDPDLPFAVVETGDGGYTIDQHPNSGLMLAKFTDIEDAKLVLIEILSEMDEDSYPSICKESGWQIRSTSDII